MKKKISLIILLVVISLSVYLLPKNNTKSTMSLENNNMLSFTVDGVESKTMPTKGSGYIASKITCTNGSIIVFDNDNWTIEVEKLETDDACYIDFVTNGITKEYDYTGNIEVFTAPTTSEYILETWGSEGGSYNTTYIGGYGGYSTGTVFLNEGEKLYIVVGGKGTNNSTLETIPGGYNGGGTGAGSANLVYSSSGGGATHIAKTTGLLNTLSNKISDIIMVAGGGGGTSYQSGPYSGSGGSGGGYIGNNGTNTQSDYVYGSGGSQTAGGSSGGGSKVNNEDRGLKGSFGQGGNGQHYSGGGGGGFYGGGASNQAGAGGGSGYIGNTLLSSKVMYCYKCTANSSESTKTISTDNVSSTPISNYAKKGNGYVKIKQVVNDSNYYTVKINTDDSSKIDSTSKTTTNNGKVTFYVSGEIESVTGCDNTVNDNKIIVNNVTSNTICNVKFKSNGSSLATLIQTNAVNENGYRYEGVDPNNYIIMEKTNGTTEIWRIIGLFPDGANGENVIRVRKVGYESAAYNSKGTNHWPKTILYKTLSSTYSTANYKNTVNYKMYLGGANIFESYTSQDLYDMERMLNYKGNAGQASKDSYNSATTFTGSVGLMYPSDYGYAVLASDCARTTEPYNYRNIFPALVCHTNNWLYQGSSTAQWLISPNSFHDSVAFTVSFDGYVSNYSVTDSYSISPVMALKSDVVVTGSGTQSDPYVMN